MKLSELKEQVDNQLKNYGDSEVNVSVDVSTGENDSPHRIFADILVLDNCFNLLCEKTYDNGDDLGFKREFTPEEKKLIINTKITRDSFDLPLKYEEILLEDFIHKIEILRFTCANLNEGEFKNRVFNTLVSMLPNSYKVVKL